MDNVITARLILLQRMYHIQEIETYYCKRALMV